MLAVGALPPSDTFFFFLYGSGDHRHLHSFPTRRSSDLTGSGPRHPAGQRRGSARRARSARADRARRSEEHTSELQSHHDLVCRLLLEKKKKKTQKTTTLTSAQPP